MDHTSITNIRALVISHASVGSGSATVTVEEPNQAPTADANGPYLVETCQIFSVDGTGSSDPDKDPLNYEWLFEGEIKNGPVVDFAAPCAAGLYQISLTVDDGLGGSSTASTTVEVVEPNHAPVADPNGPYLGELDAEISFDGTASSDPDGDPLNCDWAWGDGSSSTDAGTSPNHAFSTPGIYDVCLTVFDPEGASDTVCTYAVVYDPTGGFVTGGGWIDSPADAYKRAPSLSGKANFGFVSKYKKGSEVRTGSTEFQFQAADLNFHSDSYDWLVVTGSDYAMFKGVGTINGMGQYLFRIWAGDDEPDTFRIKIWTEDEFTGFETVIYDNGMDQAVGGGSIVIHTKNK